MAKVLLLASVIVHPDSQTALPLLNEPIKKQDKTNKNDCERNVGKQSLLALKQAFPRLKMIVLEEALATNGSHILPMIHWDGSVRAGIADDIATKHIFRL